jgi:hypothetical protein
MQPAQVLDEGTKMHKWFSVKRLVLAICICLILSISICMISTTVLIANGKRLELSLSDGWIEIGKYDQQTMLPVPVSPHDIIVIPWFTMPDCDGGSSTILGTIGDIRVERFVCQ